MVIGPTPPGTGVIALVLLFNSSKFTSPTIFSPTLFIPTSITIAFSLTQSFFTSFGTPTAAIKISALRHSFCKFSVFECTIVTVQFYFNNNWAIGLPFRLDLPIITTCFPDKFFSTFLIKIKHPNGVQGTIEL